MKGEDLPVIRKGAFKEWKFAKNILLRGGIGAIILFLLLTINNSIEVAFWITIVIWFACVLIFIAIFFRSEYYERSIIKKNLKSDKYDFFDKHNFEITEDMTLEGCYKGYELHVLPMTGVEKKMIKVQYDVIITYYSFLRASNDVENADKEQKMCGEYYMGEIIFNNQGAYLKPKEWSKSNYEEVLDGFVNVLNREDLQPITREEWLMQIEMKLPIESDFDETQNNSVT